MGRPVLGSGDTPPTPLVGSGGQSARENENRAAVGFRRATMVLAAAIVALAAFFFRTIVPEATAGIEGATRDFFTLSISVVIESLPFVFLGILVSILVQVWLPADFLFGRLPTSTFLRRLLLSLLGMLMPVCQCGNVPMARGLMVKGLTAGESMTFLFAAPVLNPITIITTQQAFGSDNGILAGRIAGAFFIANLVGWIYRGRQPGTVLTPGFEETCATAGHHHPTEGRLKQSVRLFTRETDAIMPALFIGAGLAGLIQVGVPRDLMVALGSDPLWSVLALMALAFVVAICSTADAFFILSFGATFLPGAVVGFLVFGPMIDVKMLALLRTTFTTRTLLHLTLIIGLCSAVLGWAVNLAF